MKSSPKFGKSVIRFAVVALLAGAATGCSSDASRFSGLFSSKSSDNITTASIPQRQQQGIGAYGQAPTPRANLGSAQAELPPIPPRNYNTRNTAMAQPYPGNSGYTSPVRAATAPVSVQRTELAAPTSMAAPRPAPSMARDPVTRQEAMAQPFPTRQVTAPALATPTHAPRGDNVITGTTRPLGSPQSASTPQGATPMSGWSTVNAPKVTLKPGETASTLSKRYGVPEKEILKANGGKIAPGQPVIIPTFGMAQNSAKNSAGNIDLQNKAPVPAHEPDQKVAVLPTQTRDKAMSEPAKLTPPGGKPIGGTYTVKPGDTIAKIARETGTPIDQLKASNNLSSSGIRVGQTLKVGKGMQAPAADPVKTASIPPKPLVEKPVAPLKSTPVSAPVAQAIAPTKPASAPAVTKAPPAAPPAAVAKAPDASVSDVEKKSDVASAAPQSTGIGKYRWPVSGAVIAGYGQNVDGNRNDGINISVPEGTPIKAAENGVVIYAGNGLKQLGNTVLVRHDDGKVTVYGNAGNINVTRGQKVTRGQAIAASGMSGDAKRPQVHFEVRKDATPINPITFLE